MSRAGSRRRARTIVTAVALLAGAAQHAYAQKAACSENRPQSGTIGITRLECIGRSCTVSERDESGVYFHSFAVEPRVSALDRSVPPARSLQVGDVILAIDDIPITTRDGGRRLANLNAGEAIRLRVRREETELELALTSVLGCNTPGLNVRIP
jgi:S1-C subfamily serine protease